MMTEFNLAVCQSTTLSADRRENLAVAEEMVREAAGQGAQVVVLPEMFTTPYAPRLIRSNAESAEGETVAALAKLASDLNIYLIGGSIPEQDGAALYNTCFAFGTDGSLIGKYRKAHLFDVDIKNGIRFMESELFRAGNEAAVIDTEFGKIGIGICYDVRFPEYFRKLALMGAALIVLPAAFNMTTGPVHWELTLRARAVDNQVYFAGVSTARNPNAGYKAYGNSCIINPWGELLGILDEKKGILHSPIDLSYLKEVREQLPLLLQRRPELYE